MRNIFRGLLAFLGLTALLAAGCGPNANEGVVRVAVFTSDPSLIKILNAAAAGIESRHPGLKVRLENIPYNNYQDKITTLMAAGDAPDVISIEVGNFVDLYMRGAFEDLTPYFQKDGMDPKAYYATELKRFSPGDRLYAMPSDLAPTGLVYYNKKIFDEAGVPYPTAKWSWPEPFLSICEKLVKKDKDGKIIRWAYADPYGTIADNFLLSNGGYYTDSEDHPTRMALDRPEAIQAFQFRWDMIHTYHVSPTPSQIQAFNFGPGAESMFANGQIAMMDSGIWHTPGFVAKGLDFDVVEFPRGPKGTRGWGTGGTGYAMSKECKNKDKAWEVIKELTGEQIISQLVATGMIQPALIKVAKSDAFLKSPGPASKKILLEMPKYSHYAPFVKNWSEIWNGQVGPALDPAWLGTETPAQILPKLNADLNKRYFGVK